MLVKGIINRKIDLTKYLFSWQKLLTDPTYEENFSKRLLQVSELNFFSITDTPCS